MIRTVNRNEEFIALAVFTTLAPLTVGGLAGLLIVLGTTPAHGVGWVATVILFTGILALAVSLLHLGRPWRAPLALLNLTTSWLSREVMLFGMFLFLLVCYILLIALKTTGLLWSLIGYASAIIGMISTFATGETYRLHARPSWDRWLTIITFPLSALSAGLLFGYFLVWLFAKPSQVTGLLWILTAVFLIISMIVTWMRSIRVDRLSTEARLSSKLAIGPFLWLLVLRVMAVLLALVLIGIGGGLQFYAWIPALLGELADRLLFFKTVVPVTLRGRYM